MIFSSLRACYIVARKSVRFPSLAILQRPSAGLLFALAVAFSTAPQAHEFTAGDIKIIHPWTRATPPGAKVGGGYLKIENYGFRPDRLKGGSFEGSANVELHKMSMSEDVMRMRPIADGIVIPAGGTIEFGPGSFHLMFIDLRGPLKQGERIKGTLQFEEAGSIPVEFQIDAMGVTNSRTDHH